MPYYNKDVYENDIARLEIFTDSAVWIGCGIAGTYFTAEEFRLLWPLLKGYAEHMELNNE